MNSFQGSSRTNSWTGTANLIGVHGLSENVATSGSMISSMTGVRGEAIGSTNGGASTSIGGFFTACKF